MKNKTITVSLDDIEIDISLDKIIEREVNKRLKKAEEEFNDRLPVIQISGRREGNSYRSILYAQLLASGRPEQNVFVLCHNLSNADFMCRKTADLINFANVGLIASFSRRMIELENNSRIFFTTSPYFYDGSFRQGLKNINIIHDD